MEELINVLISVTLFFHLIKTHIKLALFYICKCHIFKLWYMTWKLSFFICIILSYNIIDQCFPKYGGVTYIKYTHSYAYWYMELLILVREPSMLNEVKFNKNFQDFHALCFSGQISGEIFGKTKIFHCGILN